MVNRPSPSSLNICKHCDSCPFKKFMNFVEVIYVRIRHTMVRMYVMWFMLQRLLHIDEDEHVFKFITAKLGLTPITQLRYICMHCIGGSLGRIYSYEHLMRESLANS